MPKMNEFTAYHNGEWKPWSDVKIDPLDLGFVLGDTVFETLRTFNGKPLIYWTIKQAKMTNKVFKTIVNTDSKRIANLSSKNGIDIILKRPKKISNSKSNL